ncbi:hypothetical protein QR680_004470 [Steinernema hermaphroditum]|uniref:Uncharacterized protein n=1 Tax=Steinernema hermaphroditum TaxID=289476 RepID=A0AA39HR37_9BILA|nr:hypothetical protein QR680_004470 [Steinernema hermaphroditum]
MFTAGRKFALALGDITNTGKAQNSKKRFASTTQKQMKFVFVQSGRVNKKVFKAPVALKPKKFHKNIAPKQKVPLHERLSIPRQSTPMERKRLPLHKRLSAAPPKNKPNKKKFNRFK